MRYRHPLVKRTQHEFEVNARQDSLAEYEMKTMRTVGASRPAFTEIAHRHLARMPASRRVKQRLLDRKACWAAPVGCADQMTHLNEILKYCRERGASSACHGAPPH
jgi:hypothetical protein